MNDCNIFLDSCLKDYDKDILLSNFLSDFDLVFSSLLDLICNLMINYRIDKTLIIEYIINYER